MLKYKIVYDPHGKEHRHQIADTQRLITAARAGDDQARDDLIVLYYYAYSMPVISIIKKRYSNLDPADIESDILLHTAQAVQKAINGKADPDKLLGYLKGTFDKHFRREIGYWREEQASHISISEENDLEWLEDDTRPDPEQNFYSKEIQKYLSQLKPKYRKTLKLRFIMGYKNEEIVQIMGYKDDSSVKKNLARGLAALSNLIRESNRGWENLKPDEPKIEKAPAVPAWRTLPAFQTGRLKEISERFFPKLIPQYQEALTLSFTGASPKEMAAKMRVSKDKGDRLRQFAKKRLMKLMEESGYPKDYLDSPGDQAADNPSDMPKDPEP
jgi:RNA polymerase sigma factor (sigma-70 family)